MEDNQFGVPAGWYPDPLGLPQLRWWDNRAWTEHTSEARAPSVSQPVSARAAVAGDDLPSRREQREKERGQGETDNDAEHAAAQLEDESELVSAQPLLAMTLRELEPPEPDTVDEDTPGPPEPDTVDEDTPGPLPAADHANSGSVSAQASHRTVRSTHRDLLAPTVAPGSAPRSGGRTYTAAVWTIALMPVLQTAASVLLITAFNLGHNFPLLLVVWLGPYLIVLGLAAYDRLVLVTAGHERPASPLWAALTAPGYLIVRALRTNRETGRGFAPLTLWSASALATLASVLVLPGLLVSLLPSAFSAEVEQSVQATAATLGADITLECPDSPPLLIGEIFTCRAAKPTGDTDSIAVSLQRANGWIAWQVVDWGLWVLTDP